MAKEFFFFYGGWPGQWWKAPFKDDTGMVFYNAEQYMMYQKAALFGDMEMGHKIMATTNSREMKDYGRGVKDFVKEVWDSRSEQIVWTGNFFKFTEPDNKELLDNLLAVPADMELVEASPKDRRWGIGLAVSDPRAHKKEEWLGLNLLGIALTSVRDYITAHPEVLTGVVKR